MMLQRPVVQLVPRDISKFYHVSSNKHSAQLYVISSHVFQFSDTSSAQCKCDTADCLHSCSAGEFFYFYDNSTSGLCATCPPGY